MKKICLEKIFNDMRNVPYYKSLHLSKTILCLHAWMDAETEDQLNINVSKEILWNASQKRVLVQARFLSARSG